MKYPRALILAAAFATAATSAQASEVKTDFDHQANFASLHSYSWGQVKTDNPFYVDRIKQEVDKDLQAKGWQLMPSGGDATIFAVGNVHNQQELQTMYDGMGGRGWGGGWGWGGWGRGGGGGLGMGESTTTTVNQPVGQLVIDIFQGQSKQLVFRGISTSDLKSNEEKNTKELDKDIDKMFSKFPPGK